MQYIFTLTVRVQTREIFNPQGTIVEIVEDAHWDDEKALWEKYPLPAAVTPKTPWYAILLTKEVLA